MGPSGLLISGYVFFFRFGIFSAILFSNTFPILFSLSSPSGIPIMYRLAYVFYIAFICLKFGFLSEELKSLLMKVKKESEKVGLKPNTQKMKIMASGHITSWQIDGETVETVADFILRGLQNHCRW